MRAWLVYILRCGDGSLYTGIATDVSTRVAQHRAGTGAKYTRGRGPFRVVFTEALKNRSIASVREAAIKRLSRTQKLALIASHGKRKR